MVENRPDKFSAIRKVAIWGDMPIDEIEASESPRFIRPGGPGTFIYNICQSFGIHVIEVTKTGEDFPRNLFVHAVFIPNIPAGERSMRYIIKYDSNGQRTLKADLGDCREFPIFTQKFKRALGDPDILFISPLRPVATETIKDICINFPECLKVALLQGWCREIDDNGLVKKRDTKLMAFDIEKMLNLFGVMIYSDEDMDNALENAKNWSKNRKIIIIVTQNKNGCTVSVNGVSYYIKAYHIDNIANPTGAGDRFATFFALMFKVTDNPVVSADFANAATAYALQNGDNEIQLEKIFEFAKGQGVIIDIK